MPSREKEQQEARVKGKDKPEREICHYSRGTQFMAADRKVGRRGTTWLREKQKSGVKRHKEGKRKGEKQLKLSFSHEKGGKRLDERDYQRTGTESY